MFREAFVMSPVPCPKCQGLAYFNSYFQRNLCTHCGWVSEQLERAKRVKRIHFKGTSTTITVKCSAIGHREQKECTVAVK